jgi:hypothetical protein
VRNLTREVHAAREWSRGRCRRWDEARNVQRGGESPASRVATTFDRLRAG